MRRRDLNFKHLEILDFHFTQHIKFQITSQGQASGVTQEGFRGPPTEIPSRVSLQWGFKWPVCVPELSPVHMDHYWRPGREGLSLSHQDPMFWSWAPLINLASLCFGLCSDTSPTVPQPDCLTLFYRSLLRSGMFPVVHCVGFLFFHPCMWQGKTGYSCWALVTVLMAGEGRGILTWERLIRFMKS